MTRAARFARPILLLVGLTACRSPMTTLGSDTGTPAVADGDPDGDGYTDDDCEPDDAAIHPGADELCDGVDNNCDGVVDENGAADGETWYRDADTDGYGVSGELDTVACTQPVGFTANATDCDDADSHIHPTATESCNGVDDDCDGAVDEETAEDATTRYLDADGDGYGGDAYSVTSCDPVSGFVEDHSDCDDGNAQIHPDADERCDGVDNDCDGSVDGPEALDPTSWYPDDDGDGYGDEDADAVPACEAPTGTVARHTDCDDGDSGVHPGATETWYDGVDSDCDGSSDYDADADGYDSEAWGGDDCRDTDRTVNPGMTETWYDGWDSDCDGSSDYDADADGHDAEDRDGDDCDDHDADIHPDATETWYDGVDTDCDGLSDYDVDLDGWDSDDHGGGDCDDLDPIVHPYAWEVEGDEVDNDCDGDIDGDDTDEATALSLADDDYEAVSLTGFSFPFCGDDHTDLYVTSNGMVTFVGSTTDYTEDVTDFLDLTAIAVLWDDLNPASAGDVYVIEYADAVGIYYRDVVQYGASDDNSAAVVLFDDGAIAMSWETVDADDALVGWSCDNDDEVGTPDLSLAWPADVLDGALGLGSGTEDAVYELFELTSPFDLENSNLWFCGTAGVDADDDGWTDLCGDPDDSDDSITP